MNGNLIAKEKKTQNEDTLIIDLEDSAGIHLAGLEPYSKGQTFRSFPLIKKTSFFHLVPK